MTGVILTVHVVHYPLFLEVGAEQFPSYHQGHMRRIIWVVGPVMLVEVALTVALVALMPSSLTITGLVLLAVIWAVTGLVHVPQHSRLQEGYDPDLIRTTSRSNGIRTMLWVLRSGLAFALLVL
ncbi:MAG: hypothetical protein HKN29_00925 [Rhodothermales bacterium]|nr:hypothetical protein [Rhodothermales bacterium]